MNDTYGPYTAVRRVENLLFVSGQVGINPETKIASSDLSEQTSQALKNMEQVLRTEGAELQDVVKTTIFLTDMDNFDLVNTTYEKMFSVPRPARSTLGVRELPRVAGATPILVEIEAVAHKKVL